jgi:hypothetical protein
MAEVDQCRAYLQRQRPKLPPSLWCCVEPASRRVNRLYKYDSHQCVFRCLYRWYQRHGQ